MTSERIIYSEPAVLIDPEGTPAVSAIRWVKSNENNTQITVKNRDGKLEHFPTNRVSQPLPAGRILFESNGVTYRVRELREQDGRWVSALKTELPVEVLETLINQGVTVETESVTAHAMEDSPYVIGVTYYGPDGPYMRIGGDWLQVASADDIFSGSNIFSIEIDPEKVDEFIALYDKNYVSLADLGKYESADSDEASEQSDEQ
jgi:hypothetical protein